MWDYFVCDEFKEFVPEILEGRRTRKSAAKGAVSHVYFTPEEADTGNMMVDEVEADITTASEPDSNDELFDVDKEQFDGFKMPDEA